MKPTTILYSWELVSGCMMDYPKLWGMLVNANMVGLRAGK
jgi:hypothetical protein